MIEIETIENSTKGLLHIEYDAERKALIIDSDFNPHIIDSNFEEMDLRLKKLEEAFSHRVDKIDNIISKNTLLTSKI